MQCILSRYKSSNCLGLNSGRGNKYDRCDLGVHYLSHRENLDCICKPESKWFLDECWGLKIRDWTNFGCFFILFWNPKSLTCVNHSVGVHEPGFGQFFWYWPLATDPTMEPLGGGSPIQMRRSVEITGQNHIPMIQYGLLEWSMRKQSIYFCHSANFFSFRIRLKPTRILFY